MEQTCVCPVEIGAGPNSIGRIDPIPNLTRADDGQVWATRMRLRWMMPQMSMLAYERSKGA